MKNSSKLLATVNSSIDVLGLSTVISNILKRYRVNTVGRLLDFVDKNPTWVCGLGTSRSSELKYVCSRIVLVDECQVIFLSRFYYLLEKNHLSIAKFSRASNISPWIIYTWRTRGNCPKIYHLVTISKFFNVSLDYLCGRG